MTQFNQVAVAFHPVRLNAFETHSSEYFDYDAAEADGIFDLTVHPELLLYDIDTYRRLRLDLRYDPADLPQDAYGLPKGDEQLRMELTRHLADLLPIEPGGVHFEYADHGLQAEGLIVMDAGQRVTDRIDGISAHEWIELLSHPQVARVTIDGNALK